MSEELKLIWGRHGIYAVLNRDTPFSSKRERVLESLRDAFEAFNANDGALIFALSTPDAAALYNLTYQAERFADKALSDPNVSIREIGLALQLKFALAQTRIYLLWRDDWEDILKSAGQLNEKWKEVISPIIERHLETGALSKDDLAEDLLR